jgi:hypothetical protein
MYSLGSMLEDYFRQAVKNLFTVKQAHDGPAMPLYLTRVPGGQWDSMKSLTLGRSPLAA